MSTDDSKQEQVMSNFQGLKYRAQGKDYTFAFEPDSPLGALFDAACTFRNHILNIMNQKVDAQKKEEEVVEKPKPKEE